MGKKATTAAESEYYLARAAAAASNADFSSREKASGLLGIDRTRLARIEGGSVVPHPDEVAAMARAYGAPELCNHFCADECPIGCGRVCRAEGGDFDRLTLQVLGSLKDLTPLTRQLVSIAADGRVDESERASLRDVLSQIARITAAGEELRLWAERNLPED